MPEPFDPGALLGSSFALGGGARVRLRLARGSDSGQIRSLAARVGAWPEELELARLVHFDPRRRVVICATALIGGAETLVGVGARDLDGHEPEVMIVDADYAEALSELLGAALAARATAAARTRAA